MVQKPRKIYCIDVGLRNSVSFKFSEDSGKSAENIVFIELKRKEREVYFWRGKKEVDFIVKNKDNTLTAINISYSNKINEREIESLKEFKRKHKKCTELILITKDVEKGEERVKFIPLWKWLLI